jgi:hypothetical protein
MNACHQARTCRYEPAGVPGKWDDAILAHRVVPKTAFSRKIERGRHD